MYTREDNVLSMQITLIPLLLKAWKIDLLHLSKLFETYNILSYIDISYELFDSTGIQGIINELEDYIKIQGGNIK